MEDMLESTDAQKVVTLTFSRCCRNCGREFSFTVDVAPEYVPELEAMIAHNEKDGGPLCDDCATARERKEEADRELRHRAAMIENTGISEALLNWYKAKGNRELAADIYRNAGKNLFICGGYGTGKTRATAANAWRRAEIGERVRFFTFSDLCSEYASMKVETSPAAANRLLDFEFAEPGIVVLDDLCKRRITAAAGEMLLDIFDRLYTGRYKCRLWVTSNIDTHDLPSRFESADLGDAVYSRIDRMIDDSRMVKLEVRNG